MVGKLSMIDIDVFIGEIKRRPIIYDCRDPYYSDKVAKTKAWHEVAEAVITDWGSMNANTKEVTDKTLRSKWRHMRDYFIKELKITGRKTRVTGKRRKRYTYYHKLLFLLPSIEAKNYPGKPDVKMEISHVETLPDDNEGTIESTDSLSQHQHGTSANINAVDPLCEVSLGPFENEFPDIASSQDGQRIIQNEEDYEKMFLLSLLPSLRQVPENMKLQVRIEMQQVLVNALRTRRGTE